jgi:hypothetical protein
MLEPWEIAQAVLAGELKLCPRCKGDSTWRYAVGHWAALRNSVSRCFVCRDPKGEENLYYVSAERAAYIERGDAEYDATMKQKAASRTSRSPSAKPYTQKGHPTVTAPKGAGGRVARTRQLFR